MRFSIIIPTYQRRDLLDLCLNCLEHYFQLGAQDRLGHQVEVIVTDDAHQSSVRSLLSRRYPWCRYVEGPQCGPAANRNHGSSQSSGDWIVFTDDDCLPKPGWIEAFAVLAHQFDLLEGRTSAAGTRTRVDEECPINETGGFLWSCNFAIRREAFLALGGFNENFPAAAMEDVELNLRANKAGLARAFVPDAVVLHPWRLRKDANHVIQHSLSVAEFVRLHPEVAKRFNCRSQALNLMRMLKRDVQTCFTLKNMRGLIRQMRLRVISAFLVWHAVRQL